MLAAAKKPEAESAVENKAEPEAPASPSKRGAPKEKPPDEYEKDTEAPEEVNLTELLLPDGSLPRQSFALTYSMAALDGWVKQASPACAAASVAGAWNALMALKRRDDGALTQANVLGVYRTLLDYLLCDQLSDRLSCEGVLELMMLSNLYGLSRLEQLCARRLASRLDESNVQEIARCASLIGEQHLHRAADRFARMQAATGPGACEAA